MAEVDPLARVAHHAGRFVLKVRDKGKWDAHLESSQHVLQWCPPPRKTSKTGVIGWCKAFYSSPQHQSLPSDTLFRIHICRESPCTGDWALEKYGHLEPPSCHGQILRLVDFSDETPAEMLMPLPLPTPDELPPLDMSPTATNVDSALVGASVMPPPTLPPFGVALSSTNVDSEVVGVSSMPPPLPPPPHDDPPTPTNVESAASAASSMSQHVASSPHVPSVPTMADSAPVVVEEGGSSVDEGGPVSDAALAALLENRANEIAEPRAWVGPFEFIVFSALQKRRVELQFQEGHIDVVMAYGPQIMQTDWSMQPFRGRVVACRKVGRYWETAAFGNTSHFVAGLSAAAAPETHGRSVVASCLRLGFVAVMTICDGDCGVDAMCVLVGSQRNIRVRMQLRRAMRDFIHNVIDDPDWQRVFKACQEVDEDVDDVDDVDCPMVGAPATHERGDTRAKGDRPTPTPPCKPGSGSGDGEANDNGSGELDKGASDLVLQGSLPDEVMQAVRWGTGLPNPTGAIVTCLAAALDAEAKAELVSNHKDWLAEQDEHPRTWTPQLSWVSKRRYKSSTIRTRLNDVELFKQFAAKRGFDFRGRLPNGVIREFLQQSCTSVTRAECKRARGYLSRAIALSACDTMVLAARCTEQNAHALRHVTGSKRLRSHGGQGRAFKAPELREALWEWFCTLKRSVRGRISPAYVLRKAKALSDSYILAHLQHGEQADAPEMNRHWLWRWRVAYNISLKKPNRKWKVPRHILLERLEIFWLNLCRVRRLCQMMHGTDPDIINFDQSPFHMNESGSKESKTLEIRGTSKVTLKEGHSASRERWSANTLTCSRPSAVTSSNEESATSSNEERGFVPPLEIMFKSESGGPRLHPRLLAAIPPWAPWMSVVLSDKGSYRETHILDYLETVLEPWRPGREWRLLLCDAYKPQMTDAVRRCAWHRGYILVIVAAGATGIVQVNDTDLHQALKRLYMEMEQADASLQQRLFKDIVPVPRKEDCLQWMAALWSQKSLHTEASKGFWKTGVANNLDGSQDHLMCREAGDFWRELGMSSKRADAVNDVEVEVRAGRLGWTYADVEKVIMPYPSRGHNADNLPDDEGSESGDEPPFSTYEEAANPSSENDIDRDGGEKAALADVEPTGEEPTPTNVGADTPTNVGATSVPGVGQLVPADCGVVHERIRTMDTLTIVRGQLESIGKDNLMVVVDNAIRDEERRVRHASKKNPAIIAAFNAERELLASELATKQLAVDRSRREKIAQAETIKQLREEQLALEAKQFALHRAVTAKECMDAMKSFDAADLGQGHVRGGTTQHYHNRMNVLERIKARGEPFPPSMENDWQWFKARWDKARLGHMHPNNKDSWGSQFLNSMKEVLQQIEDGDAKAFIRWVAAESRRYLDIATLKV